MKKHMLFALISSIWCSNTIAGTGDFTVSKLGVSNNSNSVFIETLEDASSTACPNKKLLRISDTDKSADRILSIALAAQAQGKKVEVVYSDSECFDNGPIIQVIKIKL